MAFDVADVVPLTVNIYDPSGTLADAGAVALTITLPDGTTAAPAVTHPSTGVYQTDYSPTVPGRHLASWVATGANASGYTDVFDVLGSAPHSIVSLADAKAQLNITDTNSDEELRAYIEAATDVCERVRGEALVRRTISEEHEVSFAGGRMALAWTPVVSLTSVQQIDGWVTWDVSRLHVNPTTGVVSTTYLSGLYLLFGRIAVTYVAGYTVVPAAFQLAAQMIVAHLWQTKRGVRGAPRMGGVDDTSMVPGFAFAVPNRALELLGTGMPGFA